MIKVMTIKKIIPLIVLSFFLGFSSFSVSAQAPGDMQFERKDGDPKEMKTYPPSIFQHWIHRMRYRCDACHNTKFAMKAGETATITHDLMDQNKFCSACHNGDIAFDAGFKNCNRCHIAEVK